MNTDSYLLLVASISDQNFDPYLFARISAWECYYVYFDDTPNYPIISNYWGGGHERGKKYGND